VIRSPADALAAHAIVGEKQRARWSAAGDTHHESSCWSRMLGALLPTSVSR